MYNLNQKQKIVLGILVAIVAGFICYYVYAKEENNDSQIDLENKIETQDNQTKEKETYSDDRILVHVSGAVYQEGIVELKVNSRIADAIEQAGGAKEEAFLEEINLAYPLEDGMKVHIPTKQEKEEKSKEKEQVKEEEKYITTSSGLTGEKTTEKDNHTENVKINLNVATQSQLETLPGIGPSTATKIIDYRKEKGKFTKVEDIKEVSGIGEAKFEKIKNFIYVK